MAYRRVLLQGERVKEAKTNIDEFLSSKLFKANYPDVKTKVIVSPTKEDTLVVDLNGDGADSVSKKVKDIGGKYKLTAKIKNEKPLTQVKESKSKLSESQKSKIKSIIKEEIISILKEK